MYTGPINVLPAWSACFEPRFSSRNTDWVLQQGLGWPHLMPFFLPVSSWAACLWPGSVFQKHSYLPAQALGLLWSCNSFHGAPVCDRVCPALKVLWWKCLCAKSSINIRSRPGCGVSKILPMSAIIKGSGHRKVGNGGHLPIPRYSKGEIAFLFQFPLLWLTLLDRTRPILPFLCLKSYKNLISNIFKENCQLQTISLPTSTWLSWPTTQHHTTAPPGG